MLDAGGSMTDSLQPQSNKSSNAFQDLYDQLEQIEDSTQNFGSEEMSSESRYHDELLSYEESSVGTIEASSKQINQAENIQELAPSEDIQKVSQSQNRTLEGQNLITPEQRFHLETRNVVSIALLADVLSKLKEDLNKASTMIQVTGNQIESALSNVKLLDTSIQQMQEQQEQYEKEAKEGVDQVKKEEASELAKNKDEYQNKVNENTDEYNNKIKEAQSDYGKTVDKAQESLDKAQEEEVAAQKAVDAAGAHVKAADQALNEAKQKLAQAQSTLKTAQSQLASVKSDPHSTPEEIAKAQAQVDSAQVACNQAEKNLETAHQNVSQAQTELHSATQSLASSTKTYEEAKSQFTQEKATALIEKKEAEEKAGIWLKSANKAAYAHLEQVDTKTKALASLEVLKIQGKLGSEIQGLINREATFLATFNTQLNSSVSDQETSLKKNPLLTFLINSADNNTQRINNFIKELEQQVQELGDQLQIFLKK